VIYAYDIQQSLAADGAIACFSSNLYSFSLNADRAPQLKASVGPHVNIFSMSRNCIAAFLLEGALVLTLSACQSTRSSLVVDRHDPEAVLRAYFAAWARNETEAQTSFMTANYAHLVHEPVDSLRVLSVTPASAESPTTRVYAVSFEIAFSGGRSLSMENGRYDWTYTLTWDGNHDTWLIANYGAG
jgi:hypothetical protein